MSSLDATYLVYAAAALPLVGAATWSVRRHSAPLLFDLVDADEMVVAAIHRLVCVCHLLLGAALAAWLAPSAVDARTSGAGAVLSSLGALLALLAGLHLGLLALFFWAKNRWTQKAFPPPPWQPPAPAPAPVRSVLVPGATPPTVPMAPPVFTAPRAGLPPAHPVWTAPPPTGPRLAPPTAPTFPPPWCRPPESDYVWAPPRR